MTNFLLFAFKPPSWLPEELAAPALAGSACALVLILAFVFIRSRKRREIPFREIPFQPPLTVPRAEPEYDPFVMGSASNKRNAFRRKGNAVQVLIREPGVKHDPIVGWVLDRSSGGLALMLPVEFSTGSRLEVRPDSQSGDALWLAVQVRSVRPQEDGWQIGCKFLATPPWSVLLLFG